MDFADVAPQRILRGPVFPEPIEVITAGEVGNSLRVVAKGLKSGMVRNLILSQADLASVEADPLAEPFDGDPRRFKLGIEAMRLGLAYEYDPYFSLSIARVDPLPHQLEAVYDYFLKAPRVRFLLADDPGAGKTIMAGLLIKELKIRGLIRRVLIIAPANLAFQWQRELKDKFAEQFDIMKGEVLRANYGSNPWQERDQIITSISWVSIIEDANSSLLRSTWDLIIVDEAHRMNPRNESDPTHAYRLGQELSTRTDHFLLMTATPHKGDPENFRLFLKLLDEDVYGSEQSLELAIHRREAPLYLRRVKEALVSFPDRDTGKVHKLFTRRDVRTTGFSLNLPEADFYDALTRFVDDQSIKASEDDSAHGRALGFTMALLQRRFASSVYAVRRSLERMKVKRERILSDPASYRQEQILKKVPIDFDDLPDEEQQNVLEKLEELVVSIDPGSLRQEIAELSRLIEHAARLEASEIETKLRKLRDVIEEQGIFSDPSMKLLIFTEHKETLEYLVGKLESWGLSVAQLHGGMKIGDRDTPGTRIWAERQFRESCQVMVATEAAGEGINLQFCWFMINYDIPWNPIRLEQRMGRIHRYGQEKDCLIVNFVATNTREGRVLSKLFERIRKIEEDLDPQRTGSVFNVLGEVLPANQLEKWLREMYAKNLTEAIITSRIVEEVDTERFRRITFSTLEGLAKRQLNLSAIVGKSLEAKERRLVPEVVEDFFLVAAPTIGLNVKSGRRERIYSVGKLPKPLWALGDALEPRYGKLGREYANIAFDKKVVAREPIAEWVTPGHPLFEVVRESILEQTDHDLRRGAIFYDVNSSNLVRLDVFTAAVVDGLGNVLHRRLLIVEVDLEGGISFRQPTMFLDLVPAPAGASVPVDVDMPLDGELESALVQGPLQSMLDEVSAERCKELDTIRRHLQLSLNELIHRENMKLAGLNDRTSHGDTSFGITQSIRRSEERIDELNARLDRRLREANKEAHHAISDLAHISRAWVLPHPDRQSPELKPMVRDNEIERIAINAVIAYEEENGWVVESVEADNRGFDLISRRPSPHDPKTAIDIKFIEVKGRSGIGPIAATSNEFKTAQRLTEDYWLYVVYNCESKPEIYRIQNPRELNWTPVVWVEQYMVPAKEILETRNGR